MDRFGQRLTDGSTTGVDNALIGWPVPDESKLVGLDIETHITSLTRIDRDQIAAFGLDVFFIPLLDPDGAQTMNAIWDTQVPKSEADLTYEWSDAANAEPVWEPGADISEKLLGMEVFDTRNIWTVREWLSWASHPNATWLTASDDFFPSALIKINVDSGYFATSPAAIILGMSSPDMALEAGELTLLPNATIAEWAMMKYIDKTMDNMLEWMLGFSAEGTGTFGLDEAEDFIENLVSDFSAITTGNSFQGVNWNAITIGNSRVSVPGEFVTGMVSGG